MIGRMQKRFYIRMLMWIGGVLSSACIAAQDTTGYPGRIDYGYIKRSDARLTGYNATGIRYLPVGKMAVADVFATKENGGFINYHQSDDSYTLGAQTESFFRLSSRIVFFGGICYRYFTGKAMGGSAFIDPYEQPFDIVEYTDTTRGVKNLETYRLAGAISTDLTHRVTLSAKVDYHAANYAKQKDLRHKNRLLDMSVTAGASWRLHETVELGANYFYRRSVEGLNFNVYGTTDKRYYSLISYGAFFGAVEEFGETGYTQKNDNTPMYNRYHGASMQLHIDRPAHFRMFHELTYKQREGGYGRQASARVLHSRHRSDICEYKGAFLLKKGSAHHRLDLHLENESLENLESVYRHESLPGGTTVIVYYDPLKVADKQRLNASIGYTADIGVRNFNPRWTFKGGIDLYQRKQTLSLYPYYRKQTIRYVHYHATAVRNLVRGKNEYGISVGARYTSGGGTMAKDGQYATPGEDQTKPKYNELYLAREYEYLTAAQIRGDVALQYSRVLNANGTRGYVAMNGTLTRGFNVKHLEGNRFASLTLRFGCLF